GQRGPPGVVLVGERGAEQGHEPVAEELVDRALVPVHLDQDRLEEPVEQRVHGLGSEPLGQRGRAGDVAEENRHLLALALEGGAGGHDALGQVLWRVAGGGVEVGGRRAAGGGVAQVEAAAVAEVAAGHHRRLAARAVPRELSPALAAKPGTGAILRVAPGTVHAGLLHGRGRRGAPGYRTPSGAWPRAGRGRAAATRHLRR